MPKAKDPLAKMDQATRALGECVSLHNATETGWFQSLLDRYPVCFPKGRISFGHPAGGGSQNRQGQAIFCLGDEATQDKFVEVFSTIGVVLKPQ